MNPPAVITPPPGQVAPVSAMSELNDTLSQALFALIKQQPFFKGLNNPTASTACRFGLGNEI
jgi:hypothetical protein